MTTIIDEFQNEKIMCHDNLDRAIVDEKTSTELYRKLLERVLQEKSPAFSIPSTSRIGLSRDNRLRKDSRQTIYYGKDLFDVWTYRLLPQQIVVLSLFDGIKTISEIGNILADLSQCNQLAAEIKVRYLLHTLNFNLKPTFLTTSHQDAGNLLTFDPLDYLIPDTKLSVRLDAPTSLILMPTNNCLTDCEYCYSCRKQIPSQNLLRIERIFELIDEAHKIGVISMSVNGGDIFARPEHMAILERILDYGMEPGISTKGYISREKAKDLKKIGLTWLHVGIDSTQEMCDKLVRRLGYFEKVIETIYNLTDVGIRVRTNSIITSESLHLLPNLVDFLMTLPLFDVKISPAFLGLYRGNEHMLLSPLQKKWYRQIMEEKVAQYPSHKINWECEEDILDASEEQIAGWFQIRPYCSSGRTQIVIAPDGKVTTCEQSPQDGVFVCGDVTEQSIMDVWNSDVLKQWYEPQRDNFQGTACYDCSEFGSCIHEMGHCWLQVLKMQGRAYAPHPYCPKAKRPKQHWR